MTDFVLHAGLQKTGTTTLQKALFARHSQIFYLGKHLDFPGTKHCRSEEVYRALAPAIWKQKGRCDPAHGQEINRTRVVQEMTGQRLVLGSWESLCASMPTSKFEECLRRLALMFGGCRLMVTLRNPLTWIPSVYLQELKGNFVKINRKGFSWRAYLEVDDWFRRKTRKGTGMTSFQSMRNIQAAIALLGRQNVGVFLYEDLAADPGGYYGQISSFLGIDLDESLALTRDVHFHPRLTRGQLALIQETDASPWKRIQWLLSTRRNRHRLLSSAESAGDEKGARVQLPDALRQGIAEQVRDADRWLVEKLGLDLEKYGYPL